MFTSPPGLWLVPSQERTGIRHRLCVVQYRVAGRRRWRARSAGCCWYSSRRLREYCAEHGGGCESQVGDGGSQKSHISFQVVGGSYVDADNMCMFAFWFGL